MNASRKDIFSCLFFIAFWLLPITYTGLTYKDAPFFPRTLAYLQRIAHLFTQANPVWPVIYIQGLSEERVDWFVLSTQEYFRLKPFGYRTRLHEMFIHSKDMVDFKKGEGTYEARQKELARWIAQRYAQKHPDAPPLKGVRFIAGVYRIERGRRFEGRWKDMPLEAFSPPDRYVFSTHYF
jgi:hypothetical protein